MHDANRSAFVYAAGSGVVPPPEALAEGFDEEPHAASGRLAAIRIARPRRDVVIGMPKVYGNGGYAAGTMAVTAA
jgi:hypothetical protein